MRWLVLFLLVDVSLPYHNNQSEIIMLQAIPVIAQAGTKGNLLIEVEIKAGYHIQANRLKNEFLIPTTLTISHDPAFTINKIVFPPSKRFLLEGSDLYLDVYDGQIEIHSTFTTETKTLKGNYILHGKLEYQACDSVRCLFPKTIEFPIQVTIK